MTLNINETLTFSASMAGEGLNFDHEEFQARVGTGFNEYGVRENHDENGNVESVDVIFQAMEPGPPEDRNGVRITDEFLENVAGKDYSPKPPHLKDHDVGDSFARIGQVEDAWFSDRIGKLMLMTRTPNVEGSQNHQEAIARYTHEPPEIRDGSLGFGKDYEAVRNDSGEPEMKDGKFREFSTVNFPGGYDDGGVNAAFSAAIEEREFDTHDGEMDSDMDQMEMVYNEYQSMLNMDETDMEMWEMHPCSDEGADMGEQHRTEFMMLSGQPMEEWGENEMQIANRAIAFIGKQIQMDPDNPADGGVGTCPTPWAVNLLNRGYNPFDSFPSGNPQFHKEEGDASEFDDPADDADKSGENSATGDFAVDTETIKF
jgi:hypothetical protein